MGLEKRPMSLKHFTGGSAWYEVEVGKGQDHTGP